MHTTAGRSVSLVHHLGASQGFKFDCCEESFFLGSDRWIFCG